MSATAYKFDTSKRLSVSDRDKLARLITTGSDRYRVTTEYFEPLQVQARAFAVRCRNVIADILGAGSLNWDELDRQQAERPDSAYLFPKTELFVVNSMIYDLPMLRPSPPSEHQHIAQRTFGNFGAWAGAVRGRFSLGKSLLVPAGVLVSNRDFEIDSPRSGDSAWSRRLPCFETVKDPKFQTFVNRTRDEYKVLYDMIAKHTANYSDLLEGVMKLVLALPSYSTTKRLAEDFPDSVPVLEKLFPRVQASTAIVTTNTFAEVQALLGYPPATARI